MLFYHDLLLTIINSGNDLKDVMSVFCDNTCTTNVFNHKEAAIPSPVDMKNYSIQLQIHLKGLVYGMSVWNFNPLLI